MLTMQLQKLENEIRDCEARVRLHDVRLSHTMTVLRSDVRAALTGKAVAIGGAVIGSVAAWWFTRPHAAHAHHRFRDDDDEDRASRRRRRRRGPDAWDMAQRWAPVLVPFLSPLLSRKTASALATIGLPVAVRPSRPLPTVEHLDIHRYCGTWHEIARLPLKEEEQCARDVTAEYLPDGQGGLIVVNRCVQADGSVKQAHGAARLPDGNHPGQLEVAFAPRFLRWWPGAWADYWVLFVDDQYQTALVGTPDRDGLWVLSRRPEMPPADFEALKALALRYDFDTSRLMMTEQSTARSTAR